MKPVTPSYRGNNPGHYSAGVLSGGLLFVSGQLSIDPDTRLVPGGGIEEHARLALANIERVLGEAGLARSDVVQCRIYVTDPGHWEAVNRVFADFFGEHRPARAIVPVTALHYGCLVEIEAVAEATIRRTP